MLSFFFIFVSCILCIFVIVCVNVFFIFVEFSVEVSMNDNLELFAYFLVFFKGIVRRCFRLYLFLISIVIIEDLVCSRIFSNYFFIFLNVFCLDKL